MRADRDQEDRVTAHEVRALSASWAYNCQVALSDILSAAYWRSSGVFKNSYLHDMASIADGMPTLGPVVVAPQVVDPGHLLPSPYPTRSVCSHCCDMLNEDCLVNSQYLHVRHGVAVARNPPTVAAMEEVAWKMSLCENLVSTRGGSLRERRRCSCALKTEVVKKFFVLKFSPGIGWRAERMQPLLLHALHEETGY